MVSVFMCHHNTFLIYCSLENPTEERWARVSHYSVATCAIIGLVFGLAGFLLFNSYSLGELDGSLPPAAPTSSPIL